VGRDSTRAALALPRPEEVLGGLAERITHRLRHELQAEMAEQTADACRVAEKQVYIYIHSFPWLAELWPVESAPCPCRPYGGSSRDAWWGYGHMKRKLLTAPLPLRVLASPARGRGS